MTRTTLTFRNLALAIVLAAATVGAAAGPALANDWHRDRDWRHHDARRPPIVYAAPVYAAPVIVAQPAPAFYPGSLQAVIAAPGAALSINLPLVLR